MTSNQRHFLAIGSWVVAIFLPLYFNPFTFPVFEPGKVALFRTIVAIMIAVVVFSWLYNSYARARRPLVRPGHVQGLSCVWQSNPLLPATLIYGILYLPATFLSVNPSASWAGLYGTVTVFSAITFSLLVAFALQSREQVERTVSAILIGSVPVAIYGWAQYLGLDALPWYTRSVSPVQATLGRSLFLGSFLAMVIPFTLARLLGEKHASPGQRAGYTLLLMLQVTCLLLTLARGAWLGFLGGCGLFVCLVAYRWRSRPLLITVVLLIVAGGSIFGQMNRSWIVPRPGPNLLTMADPAYTDVSDAHLAKIRAESVDERFFIWRNSLPLLQQRWLLGYGPETFSAVFLERYPPGTHPYERHTFDAHNLILNLLMTVGVLGLLAFAWIVFLFYKVAFLAFQRHTARPAQATAAAMMSSVTAFLILAQFTPVVITLWALFWLTLALGVAISSSTLLPSGSMNQPNGP